jgi:hypothetical protein
MEFRQCEACRQPFRRRPQNPDQCFCSDAACQRERRRRWQVAKRQSDPDYRENQKRAQKAWSERHPDYWRAYREEHPEYVARNRARQRERTPDPAGVAKMDASNAQIPLPSGTYRLSPVVDASFAEMDAWMAEITVISAACASP